MASKGAVSSILNFPLIATSLKEMSEKHSISPMFEIQVNPQKEYSTFITICVKVRTLTDHKLLGKAM